jgi:DNA-binding HxlR family transcriptional regulator
VARALGIVGDRWTLLVVRDLLLGKSRFAQLESSLDGISPNVLSARLKSLEADGVLHRTVTEERPPRTEYELTEKGLALSPVVGAIFEWGTEWEPAETG